MDQAVLDRRVEALTKLNPSIGDAVELQSALATCLYAADPPLHQLMLPRDRAAQKTRAGVPLLHDEPIYLDPGHANDLFRRLISLLVSRPATMIAADELGEAANEHRLHVEQVVAEAFANHAEHISELAVRAGVDTELLATVAHLASRPFLAAYGDRLRQALDTALWDRGYCPICGAWPTLAELRGPELARYFRCGRCGADWPVTRLLCPFCQNDDFRSLGYLQVEGERRFKVDFCRRCNGYLKAGNAFDACPAEFLAFDDLASVHLDVAALDRGLARPADPGFRLELANQEMESDDYD